MPFHECVGLAQAHLNKMKENKEYMYMIRNVLTVVALLQGPSHHHNQHHSSGNGDKITSKVMGDGMMKSR